MAAKEIKKVALIGGSGATGAPIVRALVNASFEVLVVSRVSSTAASPEGANIIKIDYTRESLVAALKGQEAVVSAVSTFSLDQQIAIIDNAIEAGVRRFLPSEFGDDTSVRALGEQVPPALTKTETVAYLKSKEHTGMTWTAVIVGAYFDYTLDMPGMLGLDIAGNSMTLFDGGDVEFEATNLAQIGRTVAAVLSVEYLGETANQYVYINSFTVTQRQILQIVEEVGGRKLHIKHAKAEDYNNVALAKMASDPGRGKLWMQGVVEAITLIMMDYRGLCEYSKNKGLWNKRLGLPEETPADALKQYFSSKPEAGGSKVGEEANQRKDAQVC